MLISLRIVALTLLIALPTTDANAQESNIGLRLPLQIFAESSTFDGKTGTTVYRGLQLTQGTISIEAEEGRATVRDQDDGEWRFSGNVSIIVDNGRIKCDSADLVFVNSVLTRATVSGTPATFELQRADAADVTRAQAGKLDYDVRRGVIEFSDDAQITEAGNEIASHFLLYDIAARRIDADSSGDGEDRVRILYTPTNGDEDTAAPAEAGS